MWLQFSYKWRVIINKLLTNCFFFLLLLLPKVYTEDVNNVPIIMYSVYILLLLLFTLIEGHIGVSNYLVFEI